MLCFMWFLFSICLFYITNAFIWTAVVFAHVIYCMWGYFISILSSVQVYHSDKADIIYETRFDHCLSQITENEEKMKCHYILKAACYTTSVNIDVFVWNHPQNFSQQSAICCCSYLYGVDLVMLFNYSKFEIWNINAAQELN